MIQEAGIFSFVRTILVVLLVYYGLKFILRVLIPMLFKSGRSKRNETNPNYNTKRSSRNQQDSELGEYVDFEELDDKNDEKH